MAHVLGIWFWRFGLASGVRSCDVYQISFLLRELVLLRYDVLLKADQTPDNYWITAQVQQRTGSPSGYGVLNYANVTKALPRSPVANPATVQPWTDAQLDKVCPMSDN